MSFTQTWNLHDLGTIKLQKKGTGIKHFFFLMLVILMDFRVDEEELKEEVEFEILKVVQKLIEVGLVGEG